MWVIRLICIRSFCSPQIDLRFMSHICVCVCRCLHVMYLCAYICYMKWKTLARKLKQSNNNKIGVILRDKNENIAEKEQKSRKERCLNRNIEHIRLARSIWAVLGGPYTGFHFIIAVVLHWNGYNRTISAYGWHEGKKFHFSFNNVYLSAM